MASINLSSIFIDPALANKTIKAAIISAEATEQNLQSQSIWGDDRIKSIDDLMLEMENAQHAEDADGLEERKDIDDSDDSANAEQEREE